jgi:hypothetical protein
MSVAHLDSTLVAIEHGGDGIRGTNFQGWPIIACEPLLCASVMLVYFARVPTK